MRLAHEETFGPLAACFRFHTEEEVIRRANDTPFGLVAYLYTRDLARAFRVTRQLESGMVGINEGIISTEVAPFGGAWAVRARMWGSRSISRPSMSIWGNWAANK